MKYKKKRKNGQAKVATFEFLTDVLRMWSMELDSRNDNFEMFEVEARESEYGAVIFRGFCTKLTIVDER